MLIMVFVFGCVQYAFAFDDTSVGSFITSVQEKYPDGGHSFENYCGYIWHFGSGNLANMFEVKNVSGRVCALLNTDTDKDSGNIGVFSNNYFEYAWWGGSSLYSSFESAKYDESGYYYCSSMGSCNPLLDKSSSMLTFSNEKDALNYIQTGEINNPIYDNRPIEYDETVELPLMAQCQVNGNSFLFNCKQSVAHSDYTIQLSAECRLTPVYSNFASKSYADTKQSYRTNKNEIGKYDNHGVSFNTSFSTSDLLNGVDTSRKALGFKEFYNGIYINLPYEKCTLSEIVFYARNICGNKCSNWVRVTYDLVNETSKYEEIESVTGSNIPSDTKHNNSEYYPDDYLYNDDEAFNSSSNISNTLTNLKSNYTSLANFYKELFSFLPSEIWILLIGLVGIMVVIAIVIFVRG